MAWTRSISLKKTSREKLGLAEVICNTSPLQYLHQRSLLHLLPALAGRITVPPAVAEEVLAGRSRGLDLPDISRLDWVTIRPPASPKVLRLATDLGPGEAEVLALALETTESMVVLDDALARRAAMMLGIRLTGTLGVLLEAKRGGLLRVVTPFLDQLQGLRFRLSPHTRAAVLKLAGESS